MANLDIRLGYKTAAWFTANPTLVLKEGQIVALEQTGTYKLGDGVTQLSALSFLGGNGLAYTPEDASNKSLDVNTDQASNTKYPSVKAVYDWATGLFVKKGTLTTNYIQKATGTDTIGNSGISDDGTYVNIPNRNFSASIGQAQFLIDSDPFFGQTCISKDNYKAIQITNSGNYIYHNSLIDLDAPIIKLSQLTASQIVETDASKNLVSVAKATAYNKNFGTTSGTVLEGSFFPQRETMIDADKTFSSGKTEVYLNATLTAARVLTLPSASAFTAGTELIFVDEIGGITSTNTVSVARAGSDTINLSATSFVLYTPNVVFKLVTDGVSKWTGGVVSSNSTGQYQDWTPTITGFSALPSSVSARYSVNGKACTCYYLSTAGTSNATTTTVTLPFNASSSSLQYMLIQSTNSGATAPGLLVTRLGSNVADLYASIAGGAWTASGAKNFRFSITYEIQ